MKMLALAPCTVQRGMPPSTALCVCMPFMCTVHMIVCMIGPVHLHSGLFNMYTFSLKLPTFPSFASIYHSFLPANNTITTVVLVHPVSTLCPPCVHPCTPCVHPVSTLCAPCVHPVCSLCPPCVHPVSTLCPPMYTLCTPCVHPVCTLCAPCVHPVSTLCTPCVFLCSLERAYCFPYTAGQTCW